MIRIGSEPFDAAAELAAFCAGDAEVGGVASFIGRVRGDGGNGRSLVALTLEHYPGMAEAALETLGAQAKQRWDLTEFLVIHRTGRMLPGETIVLVATASRHRRAALESCQFLIDCLKTEAPFWKFEETDQGSDWVAARTSDLAATERWRLSPGGS